MGKKYEVCCYVGSGENRKALIMIQRFDSFREEGSYTHFTYGENELETIIPTKLICKITLVDHNELEEDNVYTDEDRLNIWTYINQKEQWDEVEDQLKTADFVYNNTDLKNRFLYKFFIKPLVKRYEAGERTDDLYNKIMKIEM